MIRYLDEVIRTLVSILPRMSAYVRVSQDKDEGKKKKKKNILMSFCIDKGKLLEKTKTIRNKTEGLRNTELNF